MGTAKQRLAGNHRSERVTVPGPDVEVEVRSLKYSAVRRIQKITNGNAPDKEDQLVKRLVIEGTFDIETGERIWADDEADQLEDLEWPDLEFLAERVQRVSGMDKKALAAAKNASAGAGEAFTGSPAK